MLLNCLCLNLINSIENIPLIGYSFCFHRCVNEQIKTPVESGWWKKSSKYFRFIFSSAQCYAQDGHLCDQLDILACWTRIIKSLLINSRVGSSTGVKRFDVCLKNVKPSALTQRATRCTKGNRFPILKLPCPCYLKLEAVVLGEEECHLCGLGG